MSDPLPPKADISLDNFILTEVQLLLAEKRTALSTLRTGIAVFALPLSVLSVLVATSRMYQIERVIYWLIPLLLICLGLVVLAVYLILRAIRHIRHYENMIDQFKQRHSQLAVLLD